MKPNRSGLILWAALLTLTASVQLASAFYDPTVQRWINRDPIEEHGGANLYRFADQDPISRVDYQGLFLGFSYGNWCGYSTSGQGGNPIDDLDTLCMIHDYCLATWRDVCNGWKPCNFWFCTHVVEVDCTKSPDPSACRSARRKILLLCIVLSPTYAYP